MGFFLSQYGTVNTKQFTSITVNKIWQEQFFDLSVIRSVHYYRRLSLFALVLQPITAAAETAAVLLLLRLLFLLL